MPSLPTAMQTSRASVSIDATIDDELVERLRDLTVGAGHVVAQPHRKIAALEGSKRGEDFCVVERVGDPRGLLGRDYAVCRFSGLIVSVMACPCRRRWRA